MYNTEQKMRFLRDIFHEDSYAPATLENAKFVFNRMEVFEEAAGADCCTMTAEELQEIVNQTAQKAYGSRQYSFRILRQYGKWCLKNGVPGAADGLLKLDARNAGLDKIRTTMVSGPKHLQRCLDAAFSPESEETVDNVYRTFFWLAFAGVPIEDVVSLRTSDIDPKTMSLCCRGRVIRFPTEAFDAVYNTATLYSFRYIHKNYVGSRRERFNSDQLLRGIKAEANKSTLLNTACLAVMKAYKAGKTDVHFTFRDIRMSGLFYNIFDQERSDLKRYAHGATDRLISSVMKEFCASGSDNIQKINATWEDYRRWKAAFQTGN